MFDIIDINDITDADCKMKFSTINNMIEFGYIVETSIDTSVFIERFCRRFYNKELNNIRLLFLKRLMIMAFYEDKMCPIETKLLDKIGLPHIGSLDFIENIPYKKSGIPLTNNIDFIHANNIIKFYWNTMKIILTYTGNSNTIIIIEQLLISYKSFMRNRIYTINVNV